MGVRVTRHGRDRDSRSSLHRRGSSGGEGSGSGGGGSGRGVSPSSLGGRGVSPLTLARGISPTGVKVRDSGSFVFMHGIPRAKKV